jgi:hypothetical protein
MSTRYDWPAPPRGRDDPGARSGHNDRLRPSVDVTSLGIAPPKKATRRRAAAAPHNAPVGNQNLWFPIGPSAMTNGQATGGPNVAGRFRDLQVEPTAGLRVYAASASGGVWFSPDGGNVWRPLDDFQETPDRSNIGLVANALACGALHVIWGGSADGSADEVWVGTGELVGDAEGLPGRRLRGIGFLHRTGAGWSVVKGELPSVAADTLRGETTYRIVADPGNSQQLVAGTSKGVYVLPPAGQWTKLDHWPSSGDVSDHQPIDVVLTRRASKIRLWVVEHGRLWCAEANAANPLDPAALTFTEVTLTGALPGKRLALAAAADGNTVFVLGTRQRVAPEVGITPGAQLWSVNSGAATVAAAATVVPGLPVDLFMSSGDQSFYDMCITTHPTVAGRIYVGGAVVQNGIVYDAAIYRCDTATVPMAPVYVGLGVHSDVHVLRVGPVVTANAPKREVWVGCDGGLFHSNADGDNGTFVPRNDGLAVLEAGYVASHPTNPGVVAVGFQDNGTGVRSGDTVWSETIQGDGGGIVWDPDLSVPAQSRYLRQYNFADWSSNDGVVTQPVTRTTAAGTPQNILTSQTNEARTAQFYSGTDAVSLGPNDTHIAVGTNRIWYSLDWGVHWKTLPTGTDPRAGNPLDTQDVVTPQLTPDGSTCSDDPPSLPAGIVAVKFSSPTPTATDTRLRVISLYPGGLVWLTGTRALASTGGFTWAQPTANAPLPTQAFRAPKSGEMDAYNNGANLKFLPAPGIVSDFAVHDPNRGPLGSCYVATIGARDFSAGTPGARLDTLWFFDGTDTWIPCGLRTNNPNGTWTGTRITAPALGVVVDTVGNDRSTVYVATSVGVVRGVLTIIGGPSYSWTWELFANGLPEAAVQDLSIRTYGNTRLLRAALQARGVWETDLANVASTPLTYLRAYPTDTRRLLPTALTGPTVVGEAAPPRWDRSPDVVVDVSGATPADPTESQLLNVPPAGGPGALAAIRLTNRTPKVHVLVHHRWSAPAVSGDVRVALLRHVLPDSGSVPLGGIWPALVAAAGGDTPPTLPLDGWTAASATFWKNPNPAAPPIETRMPRAVTFDLNFVPADDPPNTKIVLLAVVLSATNQISAADLRVTPTTNATTVDQLASSSPHVGAVTIELV